MTGRPSIMAALALLWGCSGAPGGYSIVHPLPAPPPAPVPEPEPEPVAGKEALGSRIEAAGGFEGMVVVFDNSEEWHGQVMRETLIEWGVPADLIAFPPYSTYVLDISQFEHERNADLLARTRVAHVPQHAPYDEDDTAAMIARRNIVWAAATGNTHASRVGGDRDMWRPDHPIWARLHRGEPCCPNAWENHMKAFATGKALLATYATRDGEGGYVWDELLVPCGEARHACFAIAQPPDEREGTSTASAKLAAVAYYVFQLYEKAEEVVDTLKECAEDIGEPGVDAEFGLGLVSLACARVENAEVLTASSSLVLRWDAPALEGLLDFRPSAGFRVQASRWIADRDGLPLARAVADYGFGRLDLSLSVGRGRAPLGVGSRYVHGRPALYAETAAGWRLFGQDDRDVRAVLSFGRGGGSLTPRTSRAGLAWRETAAGWTWSAYAGRSRIEAWVGIPGHRQANRDRSRASASGWEALLTIKGRL